MDSSVDLLCFIADFLYLFSDNLHYEKFQDGTVKCIEDEIPFELPEGWAWERLGNVSTIARGGSPRPIEDFLTDDKNGINWIKIGDTEKDGKYILHTKEKIKAAGLSKTRYVHSGDVTSNLTILNSLRMSHILGMRTEYIRCDSIVSIVYLYHLHILFSHNPEKKDL